MKIVRVSRTKHMAAHGVFLLTSFVRCLLDFVPSGNVTKKMLQDLVRGKVLNDEVINAFMAILNANELTKNSALPRCHFLHTHIYTKLAQQEPDHVKKTFIERLIRKRQLSLYDHIFLPIHRTKCKCTIHATLAKNLNNVACYAAVLTVCHSATATPKSFC